MTIQFKAISRVGKKALPLARRDESTFGWRPGPASRSPMPAGRGQKEFTIEEHLLVQRRIEERARRIWLANYCSPQSRLDDWLKAEGEVLVEFVQARMQPPSGATGPHPESGNPGNSQRKNGQ
jgi:hypothetical protein